MTPSKAKLLMHILTQDALHIAPGTPQEDDLNELLHGELVARRPINIRSIADAIAAALAGGGPLFVTELGAKLYAKYVADLEVQNENLRTKPTGDADKPSRVFSVKSANPLTPEQSDSIVKLLRSGISTHHWYGFDSAKDMTPATAAQSSAQADLEAAVDKHLDLEQGIDANTPSDDPRVQWIRDAVQRGAEAGVEGKPIKLTTSIGDHIAGIAFDAARGNKSTSKLRALIYELTRAEKNV